MHLTVDPIPNHRSIHVNVIRPLGCIYVEFAYGWLRSCRFTHSRPRLPPALMHEPVEPAPPSKYPFAQGVGTVYQFVGVTLFLISMFVCCSSSLLSKDTATHSNLTTIGWQRPGDPPNLPTYSAQRALTITLPAAICYGMALAALGLGMQTESRPAPSTPLSSISLLWASGCSISSFSHHSNGFC